MIAALLTAAVLGPIVGVRQLGAATNAELIVSGARAQLDELVRTQLAEEIGLRGFLQTHDVDVLIPDGPPSHGFDSGAVALRKLIDEAGLESAVPLLETITVTHDRWEREVAAPLLENPNGPDALSRATTGKLLTDTLRATAERLRAELADADTRERARLGSLIDTTVAISTGLVVLLALAAVVLGLDRARALDRLARERLLVDLLQQTLRVGGSRLPQTRIAYSYTSATREAFVGGDLIDAWRVHDFGWFLVGDVSGKGVQAARHAAFVQYAIRALAAEHDDPATVVERLNRLFIDTFADPGTFVTLFLGRFDPGHGVLSYASAGHGAAFVRRGAVVSQLPATGPLVGLDADEVYGVEAIRLRRGNAVLLATDGLTESRDAEGVFLGDEGVAALFASTPGEPQAVCDALVAEVARRSGGTVRDDVAILVIELVDGVEDDEIGLTFTTLEAPRPT